MQIFIELLKMPFKVFKTNKLRTLLTMFGVIVGVASVIVVTSISDATQANIQKKMDKINRSPINFQLMPEYSENGTQKQMKTDFLYTYAQANKNVVALSAISEMTWKEYANKMQEASEAAANDMEMMPKEEKGATSSEESIDNIEAKVKLVDADYFKIYHKELVAGRVFSPYEQTHAMPVALIKESSVSMFGIGQALGKEIRVNGQPVKIIGVLKDSNESDPSSANYVNSLYMLNTYQQQYGESKDYTYQFHMKLRKGVNKNNEISALKSEANKFVKADQLYVDTYIDNADSTNQMMDMLSFAFMGIALLSLFIGGVGIMNIMLVSVNERIKEIGIRCALGAHKVHIILQFLIEAIMITFIAGIIGIAFAYAGLAIANSQMSDLYLQVDLLKAIGVVGICSSIGIVFGYYPANKAANLKIADALRSE